jgi:tetratricopeptide (TPR) repeat protein
MTMLSLCMIARDEEDCLERCLAGAAPLVDEIVLVDTGSTDRTPEIARAFGARVERHSWTGSFAEARNRALDLAGGDWVLALDADEEIHAGDRHALRGLVADGPDQPAPEGYFLPVLSYVGAEPGDEYITDLRLSLFRRRPAYRYRGLLHEDIVESIREAAATEAAAAGTSPAGPPRLPVAPVRILHYGYLDGRWTRKDKSHRNLTILRAELAARPEEPFLRYVLGAELMGLQDPLGALREFEAAARRWTPAEPRHSDLLRKMALCHVALARFGQARAVLVRALDLYPDYTDLWLILAGVELTLGRPAESARAFRRCLDLGPPPPRYASFEGVGDVRAYLGLAQVSLARAAEVLAAGSRALPGSAVMAEGRQWLDLVISAVGLSERAACDHPLPL